MKSSVGISIFICEYCYAAQEHSVHGHLLLSSTTLSPNLRLYYRSILFAQFRDETQNGTYFIRMYYLQAHNTLGIGVDMSYGLRLIQYMIPGAVYNIIIHSRERIYILYI